MLWDDHLWELSNKAYLSPDPHVLAWVLLGRERWSFNLLSCKPPTLCECERVCVCMCVCDYVKPAAAGGSISTLGELQHEAGLTQFRRIRAWVSRTAEQGGPARLGPQGGRQVSECQPQGRRKDARGAGGRGEGKEQS